MKASPFVSLAALAFLGVSLASVASLAGCSSSLSQQGPSDTLRGYASALEEGRVDDAYRYLSDDAKRSLSIDAFRRAVKENPQDIAEIARAFARPSSDPVITATATLPTGEEIVLFFEGGRWRIDASAVDLYGQTTPRQAISGFLRAFERKRYDVILRYVPDAERDGREGTTGPGPGDEQPAASAPIDGGPPVAVARPAAGAAGMSPVDGQLTADKLRAAWEGPYKDQITRIVQAIKTALPSAQIEETGDSAAMSYGAGGTVAFVREHGAWKIRDF